MKIAVISDVHGNAQALRKVIEVIKKNRVKKIYSLGDIVGYYPQSPEVITIFQNLGIVSIMGNHDYALVKDQTMNSPIADKSLKLTKKQLSLNETNYLAQLPLRKVVNIYGWNILLVHGSPWNQLEERVYPDSNLEKFKDLSYDVIIMGHTHHPFVAKIGNKRILNAGSVGESRDGDKRSSFLILDFSGKDLIIDLQRVGYNASPLVKRIKKLRFPEILVNYLPNNE